MTTGGLHDEGSTGPGAEAATDVDTWSPLELELLEAAIAFYGAAEGVIDFTDRPRPQVRRDAAGFDAVRRAMGTLERRVRNAHAAGLPPRRIAEIARIEQEIVELIIAREAPAAPEPDEG